MAQVNLSSWQLLCRTGRVLGLTDSSWLVPDLNSCVRMYLYPKQERSVWIFVPKEDILQYQPTVSGNCVWLVFFSLPYYKVFYEVGQDEIACQTIIRDELLDWYRVHYQEPDWNPYDLMYMPVSCVGPQDISQGFRELSFCSFFICEGAYLSFFVTKEELSFVPEYEVMALPYYRETMQGSGFVHVRLTQDAYLVRYKTPATQWKDKMLQVSREQLIVDYRLGCRMQVDHMPFHQYWTMRQNFAGLLDQIGKF